VGSVPVDPRNIVWQAAELLAATAGVPADAAIDVDKAIPVAAGLAGGSADAAAALVALDALWGTRAARSDLLDLAAQLGSDVPFGLLGGVALGTGRGERLTPALARGRSHWVLGIAREGLSTPAVYAELDRLRAADEFDGTTLAPSDPVLAALRAGVPADLANTLANDLQAPALSLRPDLRRALTAATDAGALGALVSGSGPTVAALVEDHEAAVRLAARLAGEGLFRTVRAVHGPAPGARLIS
jgi:4-diphosphocytidyl-2-C-methyl-D-erythritol kinase